MWGLNYLSSEQSNNAILEVQPLFLEIQSLFLEIQPLFSELIKLVAYLPLPFSFQCML